MSCLPDGSNRRFKSLPTSVSRRRAVNVKAEGVRWPYPAARLLILSLDKILAATRGIWGGASLAFWRRWPCG